MRILFHGPGTAVYRPQIPFHALTGVPPVLAEEIKALSHSQQLTSNRGNIIHAEAPARLFEKAATLSAYGNLAVLQRTLEERYVPAMEERFDMIVISMANFIRPDLDHSRLTKAMRPLLGKIPFVVLGTGLQGEPEPADLHPSIVETIEIFNEHALVFGVRGAQTEAWLHRHGYSRAEQLGCPSMYCFPSSILSIDGGDARAKGADANVMTAGYLTVRTGHNFERGVALGKAFENIRASYVFQDEFMGYGDFAATPFSFNEGTNSADAGLLNSVMSRETGEPVNFENYYYFTESSAWRQAALAHDVYVGDRFHGGIAAMQAGRPAIFLCHDNRVAEMADYFGLPRLTTAELAAKGLDAVLDEYLSDEAIARMKTIYRQRHDHFRQVMGGHGLNVVTHLPPTDPPYAALDDAPEQPGLVQRLRQRLLG